MGESGCGKSVTALAIAGLLPQNAEVTNGDVTLDGKNLLSLSREEKRLTRLRDIAMVFQDPMTFLNPVLSIGSQLIEILQAEPKLFTSILLKNKLENGGRTITSETKDKAIPAGGSIRRREFQLLAKSYVISVLNSVKLPEPERVFKMFPFELSGGMRQRVMIAMAIIRKPKLLLADEVTTALDVTVQAQILQLLRELKREIEASILLITHDLAVVAEVCDRVAVMYAGNIVELAGVQELFKNPLHPYTRGLLASIPRIDMVKTPDSIEGSVPDLISPPTGCRFHPRCPKAFEPCSKRKPDPTEASPGHYVSCFLYGGS